MEIKGFLFFVGSLLRWPAQKPKDFFSFHIYILLLYGITYLLKSLSLNLSYFVFTMGVLAPLMNEIAIGFPLDCLNYKAAINREVLASGLPDD